MFTIVDIETTGFSTYDDILEVGYIRVDKDCVIQQSGTLYFYKPEFKVESSAQKVHLLQRSYLKEHEDSFDENLAALFTLVHGSVFIGKNSNRFDIPVLKKFIMRHTIDLMPLAEAATLDLQDVLTPVYREYSGESSKKGTLGQYAEMFNITDEKVEEFYETLNKPKGRTGLHTALYDAAVTFLVLKESINRNLVRLV